MEQIQDIQTFEMLALVIKDKMLDNENIILFDIEKSDTDVTCEFTYSKGGKVNKVSFNVIDDLKDKHFNNTRLNSNHLYEIDEILSNELLLDFGYICGGEIDASYTGYKTPWLSKALDNYQPSQPLHDHIKLLNKATNITAYGLLINRIDDIIRSYNSVFSSTFIRTAFNLAGNVSNGFVFESSKGDTRYVLYRDVDGEVKIDLFCLMQSCGFHIGEDVYVDIEDIYDLMLLLNMIKGGYISEDIIDEVLVKVYKMVKDKD